MSVRGVSRDDRPPPRRERSSEEETEDPPPRRCPTEEYPEESGREVEGDSP